MSAWVRLLFGVTLIAASVVGLFHSIPPENGKTITIFAASSVIAVLGTVLILSVFIPLPTTYHSVFTEAPKEPWEEEALALKVIDVGGGVTPYEPIAGAGHARGRIMAYGLGESWRPR
jgi:hypothetical protein